MMTFEQFTATVEAEIKNYLPEEYKGAEISTIKTLKNNEELTGLIIQREENIVTPTIYLDGYHEKYEEGIELDEIMDRIATVRVNNERTNSFDVNDITDWEKAKEKIIPKLIGVDGNEELLFNRPHKVVEDLAVTYGVVVDGVASDGLTTAVVSNELFNSWKISLEEINNVAMENLRKTDPSYVRGMSEVIAEMMGTSKEDLIETGMASNDEKMYVLGNESKLNGAAYILDNELMNSLCERFEDFYILPSSIHECLIVPKAGNVSLDDLRVMVQEVNDTQVEPNERLSYNIYTYSVENGLQIA